MRVSVRASLPLIAIAALALAAYFALRSDSYRQGPVVVSPVESPSRAASGAEWTRPEGLREEAASTVETAPELPLAGPRAEREAERRELAVEVEPELVRISGTLTIVDSHGVEHTNASASFEISSLSWERWRHVGQYQKVQVRDGEWECSLVERDALYLSRLVEWLDEDTICSLEASDDAMDAAGANPGQVPFPADGVLHLRARATTDAVLRVVDAETGVDLDRVSVILAKGSFRVDTEHPGVPRQGKWFSSGEHAALFEDEPSPLSLRAPRGSPWREGFADAAQARLETLLSRQGGLDFWVGSPGYAWRSASVDLEAGGVTRIAMSRGADLEVAFVRPPVERERFFLRVRRQTEQVPASVDKLVRMMADHEPSAAQVAELDTVLAEAYFDGELLVEVHAREAGPVLVRGLPPGPCTIAAELGDSARGVLRLGHEDTRLLEGVVTRVVLQLDDVPVPAPLGVLRGTLHIPASWPDLAPSLTLERREGPTDLDDRIHLWRHEFEEVGPETYAWSAGEVEGGEYTAQLPMNVQAVVRTDRENHLALPEPAEVTLTLVSELGVPVREGITRFSWYPKRPDEITGGGAELLELVDGRGSFLAPVGELEMQVVSSEWILPTRSLQLTPGPNVFTLELRQRLSVHVTVEASTTERRIREVLESLELRDAGGRLLRNGNSGTFPGSRWIELPGPGSYVLTARAPEGFGDPEPIPFEAAEGRQVELTIELVQRP